jgi:hypothetical protein
MPTYISLLLTVLLLTPAAPAGARPQNDSSGVTERGWVTARPPARGATKRPPRAAATGRAEPARPTTGPTTARKPGPVGVGFSLYRREADGRVVSVDPSATFREGDRLRIVVEPSVDGYLYVFDAENDRNPVMLFPDARLDGGDNRVQAHEAIEVPSSSHPTFKWFMFRGAPAVDRLYIVVTREPLPGVPAGDELVKFCAAYDGACPWKPGDAQWAGIAALARRPTRLHTVAESLGRAQTDADQGVLRRELLLSADDPAPTVIGVNEGASADAVVVTVDLKHGGPPQSKSREDERELVLDTGQAAATPPAPPQTSTPQTSTPSTPAAAPRGATQARPELVLQAGTNEPQANLAFSPDGRLLATRSIFSSEIKIWEVATGRLLRTIECGEPGFDSFMQGRYAEFSPDGKTIVTGLRSGDVLMHANPLISTGGGGIPE